VIAPESYPALPEKVTLPDPAFTVRDVLFVIGYTLLLKVILELDERYDSLLDEHYVLQSVQNNSKGKTPEDLWSIPLRHEKIEHYAMFPIELPLKIISTFCPPNGVVLDPFGGSGTTGMAAKQLNCNFILIELNPEFVRLIRERL
jgi:DNA modification methylase